MELKVHPALLAGVILFLLDHLIFPEKPTVSILAASMYGAALLAHESGHMIAAAFFRVRPRDIMLYPFGSIFSYSGRLNPGADFFINGAGIIASLCAALAFMPFADLTQLSAGQIPTSFAALAVTANLAFVAVNLLPLSGLDAGRMLRAVLTLWQLSFAQTVIKRVNQLISMTLLASAIVVAHPLLYAAAALVTISCLKEQLRMQTADAASGLAAGQACIELGSLICLPHRMTISQALPIIVKSYQQHFPVVHNDMLLGVIERESFIRNASGGIADDYIVQLAKREIPTYLKGDDLGRVLDDMFRKQINIAVLKDEDGRFHGLFCRSKAIEFLLLSKSVDTPSAPEINDEFMM
ncbi:MAG: hypothetical protein J5J00_12755 [Deltaproteobacteria bacterium]|nr:hypothetical protein [Deltaproteobacteria bacterium]